MSIDETYTVHDWAVENEPELLKEYRDYLDACLALGDDTELKFLYSWDEWVKEAQERITEAHS